MARELEIHNAKITGTMLGVEDHGIMSSFVYLEWSGGGVGFGGYALDQYDKILEKRVGAPFGLDYIKEIMEVVGVSRWEDLKGKYVRVKSEGWGGTAVAIGNLLEDKWFEPKEWFKQYFPDDSEE